MVPPVVSVLIPTLNRSRIVLNTLRTLEQQTQQGFEVLIIDQSDTIALSVRDYHAQNFPYHYHHIEEKGLPNARNVGARLAEGDILIFLDDDIVPDDNLVEAYIAEFTRLGENFWVIGGRIWEKGTAMFRQSENIVGGLITAYGKTLKNFDTDSSGTCEWSAGGNFAVRQQKFTLVGGFDKNYLGNAMLEDADFCYLVRAAGGEVYYSPKPVIEHLRFSSGGTRSVNRDQSMFYRAHNTVYFFRKHKPLWQLPLVFLYLNGVAVKDLAWKKHSLRAVPYTWLGFIRGFTTSVK